MYVLTRVLEFPELRSASLQLLTFEITLLDFQAAGLFVAFQRQTQSFQFFRKLVGGFITGQFLSQSDLPVSLLLSPGSLVIQRLQRFSQDFVALLLFRQEFFIVLDVLPGLFPGFDQFYIAVHSAKLFIYLCLLLCEVLFLLIVLLYELFEDLYGIGYRKFPVLCLSHFQAEDVGFLYLYSVYELVQTALLLLILSSERKSLRLEPVLQRLEPLCAEYLPEYALAGLGTGQQKLLEISLRDHGYLHELVAVYAHDLLYLRVDLRLLRDHAAVGHGKFRLGRLHGRAGAALLGSLVAGAAPYLVLLPSI